MHSFSASSLVTIRAFRMHLWEAAAGRTYVPCSLRAAVSASAAVVNLQQTHGQLQSVFKDICSQTHTHTAGIYIHMYTHTWTYLTNTLLLALAVVTV